MATLGQGLRSSDRQALEGAVSADNVVTSLRNGFDTDPDDRRRGVAEVPGATVFAVRYDRRGPSAET